MSNVEDEIEKFFSRSSHCNATVMEKIKNDILETARLFNMSIRASPWGDTSQTKLCVYGAVALALKTKDLVVPVQVWLTNQYPIDAPVIYVVPSGEEKVLSNVKLVDGTGLCYAPLLHQWSPATSSLKPVLAQLAKLFTYAPPLWIDDTPQSTGNSGENNSGVGGGNSSSPQGSPAKPLAENKNSDGGGDIDADNECVVCLSTRKDTVIVPCGHFCCCSSCASNLTTCPVCRGNIQYRQKVFN